LSVEINQYFLDNKKESSPIDYIFDLHNKIRSKLLIHQLKTLRGCRKTGDFVYDSELQPTITSKNSYFRLPLRFHKPKIYSFKKSYLKRWFILYLKINLYKSIDPIPEQYIRPFYNDIIELNKTSVSQELQTSYPFGNTYKLKKPSIHPTKKDFDKYSFVFKNQKNTQYIAIAAGATWFTKKWPSKYFIELCKKIASSNFKNKIEFVFLGGKDEVEFSNYLEEALKDKIEYNYEITYHNYIGKTSLLETSAILSQCNFLITNDSGLMHIASAFDVYIFALFLSTIPEFGYIPFTDNAEVLSVPLNCKPCDHKGKNYCSKKHFNCAHELTVEIVYNKLIRYL